MSTVNIKATLEIPKLDAKKYVQQIDAYMKDLQKQAIKRWLFNVLKNTPTYTGTARGTYAPIGRIVNHSVRPGLIRGDPQGAKRKKTFVTKSGRRYALGFGAGAAYQDHAVYRRKYRNRLHYHFHFDQRLPYVLWNEFYPAGTNPDDPIPSTRILPSGPPWAALESAAKAYMLRMNRARKEFPQPKFSFTIKKI